MKKFKVGDKVKLIKSNCVASGFSGALKNTYAVLTVDGDRIYLKNLTTGGNCGYVFEKEIKLVVETKKEIEQNISDLNHAISLEKEKLDFMTANGLDTYDDEEHKAYQVLKVIGVDDIGKAKELMKILNK